MDDKQPTDTGAETWPREPGAGSPPPPPRERERGGGGKRFLWALIAVIAAFLAGFGWQYYEARNIEDRLERTEQELAVERLRVGLAQAAVAAQSGDFEAARQQMSEFFTNTQARLEQLPPDLRAAASDMLRSRDDVITALSRANPEAAEALYGMLLRFRTSADDAPVQAAPPPMDTADTVG